MTDLTREQLEALLDGATQGPWQADGEPWNRIVWSSAENRVCFMAHSNGLDDARDIATSNLVAAAPDLARQLLATLDALAEAQAAQAGAVERCAERANRAAHIYGQREIGSKGKEARDWQSMKLAALDVEAAIRSLADPTGVKLLAELRAERDEAYARGMAAGQHALAQIKGPLQVIDSPELHTLRAERDALASTNAALEAKVAGLVGIADDIDAQVKTTREAAADSGMDRHQVELVAICTSHFLDNARHLRALAAWNRRTPEPGKDGNNG